MNLTASISSRSARLAEARRERAWARACLGLALALSAAILLANFAPRPVPGSALEPDIRSNQQLLVEGQQLMHANEQELGRTRAELQRIRKATGRSPL